MNNQYRQHNQIEKFLRDNGYDLNSESITRNRDTIGFLPFEGSVPTILLLKD